MAGIWKALTHQPTFNKLVAEGDPFNWIEQVIDPEISALRLQLKYLENSVMRLNSIIESAKLPAVGRDVAKQAKEAEAKTGGGKKHKE